MMTNPVNYKHMPVRVVMDNPITCRFDYPDQTDHSFLLSVPESFSGNDVLLLEKALGGRSGRTLRMRMIPEDLQGFRVYSIDEYMPDFIKGRLGSARDVPGPNCYQAALVSLGFSDLEGRYVDPLEAGFYFSRYFENVQGDPALGDVRIYYEVHRLPASALGFAAAEEPEPALIDIMEHAHDIPPDIGASCVHMFNLEETPEWFSTVLDVVPDISDDNLHAVTAITAMAPAAEAEAEEVDAPVMPPEYFPVIKPGVHAALILLGGMVFQRGGWDEDHVNMIVPAMQAMSSIEAIVRDKFYPPEKAEDEDFSSQIIRMLSPEKLVQREDARVVDEELSVKIAAYVPLIEHYTARLLAVSDFQWSEFARNRVDLLAMENLWTILGDIEQELKVEGKGTIRALQLIDEKAAAAYLKLRSLRWQYQVMVNRYDSPGRADSASKKTRRLRDLYKEHYISPESEVFKNEIKAHLVMRDVVPEKWAGIINRVIAKLQKVDPVKLVKGYGASQVDFFKILDQAIASS